MPSLTLIDARGKPVVDSEEEELESGEEEDEDPDVDVERSHDE